MGPLLGPEVTAGQWGLLGVSLPAWLALPLTAGLVRRLRREVS